MIDVILAQYPLAPITNRAHLVRHVQFCHALMVATDPLLTLAGMEEKRQEEQGHAHWLAQDLAALNIPLIPYDYAAAAIAGSQYYFIQHLDPRVLLGYCAVLECRTFTPAQVDAMEATLGGPLRCVRFHAEHDPAHGADVLKRIAAIDDARVQAWIYQNACHTASAIAAITHLRYQEYHDDRSSDGDRRRSDAAAGHDPASTDCDGALDATWATAAGHGHFGRA